MDFQSLLLKNFSSKRSLTAETKDRKTSFSCVSIESFFDGESFFYRKKKASSPRALSSERGLEVQKEPSLSTSPSLVQGRPRFSSLLHPDEKIKNSMEGFFLDLRSEHTRKSYSKDLKRFLKYLAVRKNERGDLELDRSAIIGFKDYLNQEGLKSSTIDRHLAMIKSFCSWLTEDGIFDKNPAASVRFLRERKFSTTEGFSDDEVVAMLQAPDLHTRSGALHYAILMVLFYCGLRRGELCSLRTGQLFREKDQVVLRLKGKGGHERMIPLVPKVVHAIEYYLNMVRKDLNEDRFLFTPVRDNRSVRPTIAGHSKSKDRALDPSSIFYIVKKYAEKIGIRRKVSPHSCRATAISNARDHKVPDRAIQEFAGWTSPLMIVQYDKRKSILEHSAAYSINYDE
jgi:integrase/recombinase XerD